MKNLFLFSLVLNLVCAESHAIWDQVVPAEQHSYKQLMNTLNSDKQFHVAVSMEKVKGVKLVLFNFDAAKRLGLEVPEIQSKEDWEEFSRQLIERFGVFITDKKTSTEMFATYYQDDDTIHPGSARGDGRVVWAGELIRKGEFRQYYIDFVLKGAGQTPLAWTSNRGHSDGLQSLEEALVSYTASEANFLNGLDTTVDLAVFLLPDTGKYRKKVPGSYTRTAITLRVGSQIRLAHLRYQMTAISDKLKLETMKKGETLPDSLNAMDSLQQYIVRRSLGTDIDTPITVDLFKKYFIQLAENLGNQAARYLDLNAIHGSLTAGNRTVTGASVDNSTWKYLDAHHGGYASAWASSHLAGQTQGMRNYIESTFEFSSKRGGSYAFHKFGISHAQWDEFEREAGVIFNDSYRSTLGKLSLARIGIDQPKVLNFSAVHSFAEKVEELIQSQQALKGKERSQQRLPKFEDENDRSTSRPDTYARFDSRLIFQNTIPFFFGRSTKVLNEHPHLEKILAKANSITHVGFQPEYMGCYKWLKPFRGDRSWEGPYRIESAKDARHAYVQKHTQRVSFNTKLRQKKFRSELGEMEDAIVEEVGDYCKPLLAYLSAVNGVIAPLYNLSDERIRKIANRWISNSDRINKKLRVDLDQDHRSSAIQGLVDQILGQDDITQNTKLATDLIQSYVDEGIPKDPDSNLGRN